MKPFQKPRGGAGRGIEQKREKNPGTQTTAWWLWLWRGAGRPGVVEESTGRMNGDGRGLDLGW